MPNYSGIWTEQAVMQAVGAGNWPGNPGAPTIGTATAGVLSASVAFTAPTNNGGSAITSYTATSSPGGFTGTGASSPITVSGLTAGTSYTFTVTATNATGTSLASAASNSITALSPNYIEDVYSTYLYTGNGTGQSIVNGINLSANGGMVWCKARSNVESNFVGDTVRGVDKALITNSTSAEDTNPRITAFNSNGFSLNSSGNSPNVNGYTYASWTFREQAKFFDVVTYTGTGSAQNIAHSLGSTPGFIIVKSTSNVGGWYCYHRSLGATQYIVLNSTNSLGAAIGVWNNTAPTSSVFTVGSFSEVNGSGQTFVAYVFAHDAGGFGASGAANVISCGSYTGAYPSTVSVNLGYEPQFVMVKNVSADGYNWLMQDNIRGMPDSQASSGWAALNPNTSGAEQNFYALISPTATGFIVDQNLNGSGMVNTSGGTYIYVAIRRGPMAVPTVGTSVFYPNAVAQADSPDSSGVPFQPDLINTFSRDGSNRANNFSYFQFVDRLRGAGIPNNTRVAASEGRGLVSSSTTEEYGKTAPFTYVQLKANSQDITRGTGWNSTAYGNWIYYFLKRAPGFFDEVCYTGTGSATTQTHNLGVVPELIIIKSRTNGLQSWYVYSSAIWGTGIGGTAGYDGLRLDSTAAAGQNNAVLNSTQPTASVFSLGTLTPANENGAIFVNYLFATCPGVSKVGSYIGTGTTQTINCGFAAGSRFVMIKRADATGAWYVWDSARGIIGGDDPYLLLNSTDAEVTNTDYVDTAATGFEISSTAPADINASGGTYIFLAIA